VAATIRDVARLAGVGIGTVSRVINNSPLVSEPTRQRVMWAIEELAFVPNQTARKLSLGKTLTISVITPFFTRPAFIERLRGIEQTLAKSAYEMTLYNVESVARRDECLREVPLRERTDGIIILSLSPNDADLPYLESVKVPIVLIDAQHAALTRFTRILIDDVAGGRAAVNHLIELGHRQIAYISDPLETPFNFTSSRDRFTGYRQALQQAGIAFRPEYHLQGEHGRAPAHRMAKQLLSAANPPSAIFAASDTQALGVLEAARESGLRVPQDLSVIGYDDIEISEYLGITTMRQQLYESGLRGVELLLASLADPSLAPVCEYLPVELVVRGTTAACP
jgi:DNA-binding LacI/PurR family transcriptional regulator